MRLRLLLVGATILGLVGCSSTAAPMPAPSPDQLSAEQADRLLDEVLDARWNLVAQRFPAAVRPEVTVVGMVEQSDWAGAVAACMVDAGFVDTTASVGGGIDWGVFPAEQAEAQAVALYACEARYPLDPRYSMELNRSQLEYLHYYRVHVLAKCLEGAGVKVSEPPSLQKFLDSRSSGEDWTPYSDVPDSVSETDWNELNRECPQFPDDLYG